MASVVPLHLAAVAALVYATASGFAADPATKHKGETSTYRGWPLGSLVAKWGPDLQITGTFGNDGVFWAKVALENLNFFGVWTASIAPVECDMERQGTRYWGTVRFIMRDQGRIFIGRWGYCHAKPTIRFKATWTGD